MTQPAYRSIGDSSLIDLLDRLVETGVVATGDVLLGLADVDLVRVNLQLVLGAVDTLMDDRDDRDVAGLPAATAPPTTEPSSATRNSAARNSAEPSSTARNSATRDPAQVAPGVEVGADPAAAIRPTAGPPPQLPDPDRSDLGIGGLLVAVIEIVHRLLERQAIHRMERGSLTSDQIERLGEALMALDQRVSQLIEIFGTRSAPALPVTVAGAAN